MSRSTREWIGRDDDQRIPDYVKDRVANKAELYCQHCRRQVGGKLRAEFDHETPLILGGKNRESNIQLLCHECHRAKTRLDVKLKAKVSRVRKKHLGIKVPRAQIQSRGFAKAQPQNRASAPIEKWRGF